MSGRSVAAPKTELEVDAAVRSRSSSATGCRRHARRRRQTFLRHIAGLAKADAARAGGQQAMNCGRHVRSLHGLFGDINASANGLSAATVSRHPAMRGSHRWAPAASSTFSVRLSRMTNNGTSSSTSDDRDRGPQGSLRAARKPKAIIAMSDKRIEHAVAGITDRRRRLAIAVDDHRRVLDHFPRRFDQQGDEEAALDRPIARDQPQDGIEQEAVDEMARAVPVGEHLAGPRA